MTPFPEHLPGEPEDNQPPAESSLSEPAPSPWPAQPAGPESHENSPPEYLSAPPLFASYTQPYVPPPVRIPHLGHVVLLAVMLTFGLLASAALTQTALHFHLFGVSTVKQAVDDVRYALAVRQLFTSRRSSLASSSFRWSGTKAFLLGFTGAPLRPSVCAGVSSLPPLSALFSPSSMES